MDFKKMTNRFQQEFEQNPVQTLFVSALAMRAGAKMIEAVNNVRSSHTWAKEVKRRNKMMRRR